MKQILLVFGTRPEFIKLIPVILEFRKRDWAHRLKVLFTGQHSEMVEPLFELFGIYPEVQLHSMVKGQSLADSRKRKDSRSLFPQSLSSAAPERESSVL